MTERVIIRMERTIEKWYTQIYLKSIRKEFSYLGENCRIKHDTIFTNPRYIKIGDNFRADYRVKIDAWDKYEEQCFKPQIIIGSNVSLNTDCYISAVHSIRIGDGVMMGRNVFISDHTHGEAKVHELSPAKRKLFSKGKVVVGNDVLIGSNVCIMPGVTIGDGCVIGANAVITHSFGCNKCIAGIPARIIKELDFQI